MSGRSRSFEEVDDKSPQSPISASSASSGHGQERHLVHDSAYQTGMTSKQASIVSQVQSEPSTWPFGHRWTYCVSENVRRGCHSWMSGFLYIKVRNLWLTRSRRFTSNPLGVVFRLGPSIRVNPLLSSLGYVDVQHYRAELLSLYIGQDHKSGFYLLQLLGERLDFFLDMVCSCL